MDFGVLTTGLGTLIGAVMAGLATWKTLQKTQKETDITLDIARDKEQSLEQKEWRDELKQDNEKLRDRAEKKLMTIEKLLDEKFQLRQQVIEQAIKIKELESILDHIKRGIPYDSVANSQPTTPQIASGSSTNGKPI